MASAGSTPEDITSECYRSLFIQLDASGFLENQLDRTALTHARAASTDASKWSTFLRGPITATSVSNLRTLVTRARDGDMSMDSTPNNDSTSAQVRRVLLLANARNLSTDGNESRYMSDMGLLGVAPAGSEALSESANTRARAPTYALAGAGPRKRPRADTDLLWPADATTALAAPYTISDVLPIFATEKQMPVTSETLSFSSILGNSNPVLRSVKSRRCIIRLRAAALKQSRLPPSPPPPPPLPISVNTQPPPASARYAALGRAAAALLLEHAGYTHASSRALDVLVDAATQLVHRAASRLSSAREQLDSEGTPENRVALAQAALADVRGGTAALQSYATYEARKAAAELVAAEGRLIARGARAPTPPTPPIPDKTDASAKLNAASYAFGVLPDGAQIDVLGIEPPPPRAMACAAVQVPDPDAK